MKNRSLSIAFCNPWDDLLPYITRRFARYPFTVYHDRKSLTHIHPETEILVVFIDTPVSADSITRLPKLKYIITMSTGYDHIDLSAAKKRGILVSNIPTYGENTVAEHTFALILALSRRLFDSVKRVKEGRYDFAGLRGTDLAGKTLGIIGAGHIGLHVARIARGFSMRVIAYDIKKNQRFARSTGFSYTTLPRLLKEADFVSLHTPLLPTTHHLMNNQTIACMKPGSFLINTARGGLVDPAALLQALNNNHLAGAGLDVLEDEHFLQNFEEVMKLTTSSYSIKTSLINKLLIDHPRTIITPHNAFNSTEALKRIIDITVENIQAFRAGKPQNRVRL